MKVERYSPVLFRERLAEEMIKKEMSAVELAEIIKVNRKTVYSYRFGDTMPDIAILCRLCTLFGCSADYLIGRTNK